MYSWTFYAVVGMLQVGLMTALLKVPHAKQISKYTLSVWSFFFAACIAGVAFFNDINFDLHTTVIAFLWGMGFAIMTLTQMHVLYKHDTSGVFPFTSLASNILVIIGGVFFLNEVISPLQWIAICASVFLFVGAHWNTKTHVIFEILPAFTLMALLSTFNKFIQKAGADTLEIHNFIFWQLFFAFVTSLLIFIFETKKIVPTNFPKTILLGWAFALGMLNVGSTYVIVKALSLGPISLVYAILGLYVFFTSMFAALLFKEKLTVKGLVFIALSFLVVMLIRFG